MAKALALTSTLLVVFTACSPSVPWRGIAKIGLIAPFSGYDGQTAYALLSSAAKVLEQANQLGGAAGVRLELVALDDENDSATAARRGRELAGDSNVVAVIARVGGDSEPLLVELSSAGLPALLMGSPLRVGSLRSAQVCAGAETEGQFAVVWARQQGSDRPSAVVANGAGYEAAAGAFRAAFGHATLMAQRRSIRVASSSEALALAREVAEADRDFVFYSGPYASGVALAKELATVSDATVVLGSDADTPSLAKLSPGRNVSYLSSCRALRSAKMAPAQGAGEDEQADSRLGRIAGEGTSAIVYALRGAGSDIGARRVAVESALDTLSYSPEVRAFGFGGQ